MAKCFLCQREAEGGHVGGASRKWFDCTTCGHYETSLRLSEHPPEIDPTHRALLSIATRAASERDEPVTLTSANVLDERVVVDHRRSIAEKLARMLELFIDKSSAFGELVAYDYSDWPVVGAYGHKEFVALLECLDDLGKLAASPKPLGVPAVRVTAKGWQEYEERTTTSAIEQVFVARPSGPPWDALSRDAINPAIRAAGLTPYVVMDDRFVGKICDRITVKIRQSQMLVAEVSTLNPNVMFEAGLAYGFGIPVVWLSRKAPDGEKQELPFDTRQYRHILWNDADQLRDELAATIEAALAER